MRRKLLLSLSIVALTAGCSEDRTAVVAKQIGTRADLIGGPGALGDVGDYLLANEQVRFVIQDTGYSRGFGIYGGSLIDADIQRPVSAGDSAGGTGADNFSELFPGLFLKAMKPTSIDTVEHEDGSASIVVTGAPNDFIFLAQRINDVIITRADSLSFRNEYRLRPGKRYVEITTTIRNVGDSPVELPDSGVTSLIGEDLAFPLPVGDVILFGAGNEVFSEGAGFDMRFTLEDAYEIPTQLPQLPGIRTPFLATKSADVSYGFMSGVTDPNLSFASRAEYENASPDDLVVPFIASAFTGAFYGAAPSVLASRENAFESCERAADCSGEGATCTRQRCEIPCDAASPCGTGFQCVQGICNASAFSYSKYFIVGDGDVASIRDTVHEIRQTAVGRVSGVVRERLGQIPEVDVEVLTFDESGSPYSQHTTDRNGQFRGTYAPGKYTYRVSADGRFPTQPVPFEVRIGEPTFLQIDLDSPGEVSIRIVDRDSGELIPGKCSLVATYAASAKGFEAREFLYELKLGERARPVDLIPDGIDPSTRRYVEEVIIAPVGRMKTRVRPGAYRAYCSRGMEYDLHEEDVVVRPREVTIVNAELSRVVDTAGWASGDFHLHAINSVDSFIALEDRVAHAAAEGLELAVATDHNYVTDYSGAIAALGIERFVQGMVGLEMSPLEIGHFNGFPLRYDPEPAANGSFEWSGRPPDELFEEFRRLGKYGPDNTVVQVNHPRDTILGYFNDYNLNADTGEPEASTDLLLTPEGPEFGPEKFSWDFDALEVYNGKRYELLRHYRVPEELPPPPLPANIPPAGTILRDSDGNIAFPGGLEDWFLLLNQGRIYTGMGNSDTHSLADEPGIPRTFFPTSDDRPGAIDELEVVAAIKNQRAFATSGPFSKISVASEGCFGRRSGEDLGRTDCGMGELARATDGRFTVTLDTQVAPWIRIDRVRFLVNGDTNATIEGDNITLAKVTHEIAGLDKDVWVLAEIEGDASMFPVVVPNELPAIQVSDALGSIGSAFGFDLNPFGNLSPSQITLARPYAFTNPVFIDVDGNGRYDAPGANVQALTSSIRRPGVDALRVKPQGLPELVKVFAQFAKGCGHAH